MYPLPYALLFRYFVVIVLLSILSGCMSSPLDKVHSPAALPTESVTTSDEVTRTLSVSSTSAVAPQTENLQELGSTLALQMGFSDEQVIRASQEGSELFHIRETQIAGKAFTVYYLSKKYEPRVLNDYATIVLVYNRTADALGEFVGRIEIPQAISKQDISSLPAAVDSNQAITVTSPIISAYQAAGFNIYESKITMDSSSNEYFAVIFYLLNNFQMLAFERQASTDEFSLLQIFQMPLLPGHPDFNYETLLHYPVTTAEIVEYKSIWQEKPSNIVPEFLIEKSLLAIGCRYYINMDEWVGAVESVRAAATSYAGTTYEFYTCFLPLVSADGYEYEYESLHYIPPINFLAIYKMTDNTPQLLWSSYFLDTDNLPEWGDANKDEITDLKVKFVFYARYSAAFNYFDEGSSVIQLTSDGKLIDLLYGTMPASGGMIRGNAGTTFEDVNDDGIMELVEKEVIMGPSDGFAMCCEYNAPKNIYYLEDDFYYIPVNEGYDVVCTNLLSNLPKELMKYNIFQALQEAEKAYKSVETGEFYIYTDEDMGNIYKETISAFITCDVTGISPEHEKGFVEKVSKNFPGSCAGFLAVAEHYLTLERRGANQVNRMSKSKVLAGYWEKLFAEYPEICFSN